MSHKIKNNHRFTLKIRTTKQVEGNIFGEKPRRFYSIGDFLIEIFSIYKMYIYSNEEANMKWDHNF
jgi:hypothetical protein